MHRRSKARELAMQVLYQLAVQGPSLLERLNDFFEDAGENDAVRQMARQWIDGTWSNLTCCDELISAAAIKWELSRLSLVDKSILRLAAYELKFRSDIPPKVTINEAIELAKKFSSAQSPGFVNGVLDAIMNRLNSENTKKD